MTELLASLGVRCSSKRLTSPTLVHVRSREEINAAEEIAQRNPCRDFSEFKPLFEKAQARVGNRRASTVKYRTTRKSERAILFILNGQKVSSPTWETVHQRLRPAGSRLRVVYDNGTESDLLLRSLQRALNKDKASRRITEPGSARYFPMRKRKTTCRPATSTCLGANRNIRSSRKTGPSFTKSA